MCCLQTFFESGPEGAARPNGQIVGLTLLRAFLEVTRGRDPIVRLEKKGPLQKDATNGPVVFDRDGAVPESKEPGTQGFVGWRSFLLAKRLPCKTRRSHGEVHEVASADDGVLWVTE